MLLLAGYYVKFTFSARMANGVADVHASPLPLPVLVLLEMESAARPKFHKQQTGGTAGAVSRACEQTSHKNMAVGILLGQTFTASSCTRWRVSVPRDERKSLAKHITAFIFLCRFSFPINLFARDDFFNATTITKSAYDVESIEFSLPTFYWESSRY